MQPDAGVLYRSTQLLQNLCELLADAITSCRIMHKHRSSALSVLASSSPVRKSESGHGTRKQPCSAWVSECHAWGTCIAGSKAANDYSLCYICRHSLAR